MIGLIKGLFGSKPTASVEETSQNSVVSQKPGAFYLNPDDAKTLGDIEYMRSSKVVRRSFPKEALGEDNEFVQAVSALDRRVGEENSATADATPAFSAQSAPETLERRQSDSSMDMFRNMARNIRKG